MASPHIVRHLPHVTVDGVMQLHNMNDLLQSELGDIVATIGAHNDDYTLTVEQLEDSKRDFDEHGHPELIESLLVVIRQHNCHSVRIY